MNKTTPLEDEMVVCMYSDLREATKGDEPVCYIVNLQALINHKVIEELDMLLNGYGWGTAQELANLIIEDRIDELKGQRDE